MTRRPRSRHPASDERRRSPVSTYPADAAAAGGDERVASRGTILRGSSSYNLDDDGEDRNRGATMTELAEVLRRGRESAGLSQEAAAEALGISRVMLSYYETGRRSVPLPTALDLARLY